MESLFEVMLMEQEKKETAAILSCNEKTRNFGLVFSEKEVKELMECRKKVLKESRRVELGEGILPEIIDLFCDSSYICQDNYADTIRELQEIFYLYKNESMDELTDAELLAFMRKQFEDVCFGDLEYLRETCLERFARAVRAGYLNCLHSGKRDEYALHETEDVYAKLDEETRWEYIDRDDFET